MASHCWGSFYLSQTAGEVGGLYSAGRLPSLFDMPLASLLKYCFILQPRCLFVSCRIYHEQHVLIFFFFPPSMIFIGHHCVVENHKFDCLSLFNRIAASTDGCIIMLFFSCFTFVFDCVCLLFHISFFLTSMLSTNVNQELQVTEIPPLCCLILACLLSVFTRESPFGKQWQTLTKLSCCALFSSTGWKFLLR